MKEKLLDEFTLGYIYSLLWNGDDNNIPIDLKLDIENISNSTLEEILYDCKLFQEQNKDILALLYKIKKDNSINFMPEHIGHDFWLLRNNLPVEFISRTKNTFIEQIKKAAINFGQKKLKIKGNYIELN